MSNTERAVDVEARARDRSDRARRDRAGAPGGAGAAPRAADRRGRRAVRRSSRPSTKREGRGFQLARVAGGYRFQTHPDAHPYVERFVLEGQTARLSGPALETLAIVAYKQPIARAQFSAIRGVNVDATLKTLVARGYIEESGHEHSPGNPTLFATTRTLPRTTRSRLARAAAGARRLRSRGGSSRRSSGVCAVVDVDVELDRPTANPPRRSARPARASAAAHTKRASGCRRSSRAPVFGSRRACEVLIAAGRVAVERRSRDPRRAGSIPRVRTITLDGVPVDRRLHARALVVEQARRLRHDRERPAGPADGARSGSAGAAGVLRWGASICDTEGLLVLTNDGELARALDAPAPRRREGVFRRGRGCAVAGALRRLREGVRSTTGRRVPARAQVVQESATAASALEIVRQGRSQADGAAHVRGGRPSRAPTGAHAHRSAHAIRSSRRASGGR